ncbi:hypothetical protein GCM10023350_20110 [Nocardioides endophyticus]|uniref:Histidine kinase/HSP90-like ATPase domain-containing protein n=1 Tax=Nocardioides endophyticus TaxID=1353775 RepID=A0ABP8YQZ2_9ACTN
MLTGRLSRVTEPTPPYRRGRHVADDLGAVVADLVGPVSQIPEVIADNIVPVLREALSNIARHAAASAGEVELRVTDDEVRLTVEDDGVGLSTRTSENGLRHARRRAETLGGSLDVRQRHPRGTAFVWRVPLG